jgi:hypothetical protein
VPQGRSIEAIQELSFNVRVSASPDSGLTLNSSPSVTRRAGAALSPRATITSWTSSSWNPDSKVVRDTILYGLVWNARTPATRRGLLKEILGIRRELSLLTDTRSTKFSSWPRSFVPADPASCLVVYATDADVLDYAAPGTVFGIDFVHESM